MKERRLTLALMDPPYESANSTTALRIISAALEPDSPGSFIGSGLIPVEASGETSIYRLLPGEPLPVSADCPR